MSSECTKVKFATEKDALFYIDKLQRTSVRKDVPARAYMCYYCGSWHITKQQSLESKRIEQLTLINKSLTEEIIRLEDDRNKIKSQVQQVDKITRRQILKEVAVDERVIALQNTIRNKDLTIKNLREHLHQLIMRVSKLEANNKPLTL